MSVATTAVADPVRLELVKNALATIAEEMGLSVVRSAYSSVVKEAGDSTAAVFDAQGRLLAQSPGAPLSHLASLRPSLQHVLARHPVEGMEDGDIYASNDPYAGGIHSNDVMLYRPVFVEGKAEFFTATLMHVADIGGIAAGGLPANATEMYHEGLILPPVRMYRAGRPEDAVLEIMAANSRTPEKVLGDVRAMAAGDNVGAGRLVELARRYGTSTLRRLCDELLAYTERRARLDIAGLPDGSHEGSFTIDDDGVEEGKDHVVRVRVTIDGDRVVADFAGTDPQARGPINAAVSQSMSGVLFAVMCMLSPDIPINDGLFGPIELRLPEGTLVNPRPPAACNARMATVMAIVEAMLSAFSRIDPRLAVASSCNVHVATMSGVDRASGRVWTYIDPQFGGMGARRGSDGVDAVGPLLFAGSGALHCVEAYELEYPVRFERFALWRDSGGPGRWRGRHGDPPGCPDVDRWHLHRAGHGPLPHTTAGRLRRPLGQRRGMGGQRRNRRGAGAGGEGHLVPARTGRCGHHAHLGRRRPGDAVRAGPGRCSRRCRGGPGLGGGGRRRLRRGRRSRVAGGARRRDRRVARRRASGEVTRRLSVGIDIGGTFTDVVLADLDRGTLHTAKELTTSDRPADAVLAGLDDALDSAGATPEEVARAVHATTLATNIVIERRGATVAYVTTEGFGDLLEIGHDRRTDAGKYDLFYEKQPPLVPRSLTAEVRERIDARGAVVRPLDEQHAEAALRALLTSSAGAEVQAVAVCLIHAYASAHHERQVGRILERLRPDVHVVLSSDACPEYRELPRANTTVVSAYVGPMVTSYVADLEGRLRSRGVNTPLQIMQSNGGTAGAGEVVERPIQLVESGPAAGVIAAAHVGRRSGADDLIAFDMGGTTAKAGLVRDGRPGIATEFVVGGRASSGRRRSATGYEVKLPVVDLAEVGAGGGSIGTVDAGGVLRVGPESAGSVPGPACYRRGGSRPTVTDADLVLGYIDPDFFLGGRMPVDPAAATAAIEDAVARPLGLSVLEAAAGIYEIANANMADAIRIVTLERGIDPSGFTLVASGGAGPAHVVRLAQAFDIARVIVPPHAGVASALGLVVSDVVVDRVRTRLYDQDDVDLEAVTAIYRELTEAALGEVTAQGFPSERIRVEREVDVRFRYQSHELSVPMPDGSLTGETVAKVASQFHDLYARLYGVRPEDPVELVNYRVRVVGLVDKPDWASGRAEHAAPPAASRRPAYFAEAGGYLTTAVHRRDDLGWGHAVAGPAIVEDASSCTVVPPGWAAEVDRWRSLCLSPAGHGSERGPAAGP